MKKGTQAQNGYQSKQSKVGSSGYRLIGTKLSKSYPNMHVNQKKHKKELSRGRANHLGNFRIL